MKGLKWLEFVTAMVLIALLLAVAGMIGAVLEPRLASWVAEDTSIVVVLGVLIAALILVSVVALARAPEPHSSGELERPAPAVDKPQAKC